MIRTLLAFMLLGCSSATETGRAWPGRLALGMTVAPGNALIVVLDDVAQADVDELSANGWTPTLDSLAASGWTFAPRGAVGGYSNPVCSPGRRSIECAHWYFNESGIGCDPMPGAEPPASAVMLPTIASAAGVTSRAMFGKWHLGGQPSDPTGVAYELAPQEHGFTYADWTPGNMSGNPGACGGAGYSSWWHVQDSGTAGISTAYSATYFEGAAATWRDAQSGPKLIVWNMNLAHAPFHRPPAGALPPGYPLPNLPLPTQRELFLAMLATADYELGQFLAGIDLSEWLVIVVGDNGTPQAVAPDPAKAKTSTFDRGVRVPFIMAGAGLTHTVSTRLVHVADILPTLADYWGVSVGQKIDGISLVGTSQHNHVIVGQGGGPTVEGDWAAVGVFAGGAYYKFRHHGIPGSAITEELYDLIADPSESTPIPPSSHLAASNWLRSKLLAAGAP